MPLRGREDFGTNADGSRCDDYCHFCFQKGAFTDPDITLNQKIDKVVNIAVTQMNIPKVQAEEMAREIIPKLKRWQR
jgi:hypothetical protein